MSDTSTDLVQEGLTAARVGDISDARRILRRATEKTPDNVEAWLGLAGVVESLEEKQKCFTKVLELEPNNSEAQSGLARVEQKLAEEHAALHSQLDDSIGVCYRHPTIETGLRCIKCNRFVCPKCAVRTPVGFRCPECVREQENKYYTGTNLDYVIATVIALPLSFIAAWLFTFILGRFGFFTLIIGFFLAPAVAGFIAEAVRWSVGKRRSRYLRHVVVGCLIIATTPFLLLVLFGGGLWAAILPGMLIFLGSATITARLK